MSNGPRNLIAREKRRNPGSTGKPCSPETRALMAVAQKTGLCPCGTRFKPMAPRTRVCAPCWHGYLKRNPSVRVIRKVSL